MESLITKIMMQGTEIFDRIDELKSEYVWDWEDEFDNIHEAYDEQGRGQAESQAIEEFIDKAAKENGIFLNDSMKVEIMENVAGILGVSLC